MGHCYLDLKDGLYSRIHHRTSRNQLDCTVNLCKNWFDRIVKMDSSGIVCACVHVCVYVCAHTCLGEEAVLTFALITLVVYILTSSQYLFLIPIKTFCNYMQTRKVLENNRG